MSATRCVYDISRYTRTAVLYLHYNPSSPPAGHKSWADMSRPALLPTLPLEVRAAHRAHFDPLRIRAFTCTVESIHV